MKFQIVDSHGDVILEWDVPQVAARTWPRPWLHKRRRARLTRELARALEELKLELFAL